MIYQFSHVIMKMLKYQLLIQKEWIIQPPNITFYLKFKKNSYCNPDLESWSEALVLGRAGKCSGKNNTWFN